MPEQPVQPGKIGKFPDGRLRPDDEGELVVKIKVLASGRTTGFRI